MIAYYDFLNGDLSDKSGNGNSAEVEPASSDLPLYDGFEFEIENYNLVVRIAAVDLDGNEIDWKNHEP